MAGRHLVPVLLFLSFVPLASLAQAPDEEPQYKILANQYIVRFRDEIPADQVLRLTRELTASQRLELRHTFRATIKGFSATIPPRALAVLRQHPAVLSVEPNGVWYLDVINTPTGLTATPAGDAAIDLAWTDNSTTEIGYEISRSTNGAGGPYATLVQSAGANVTAFTDTDVVADQEYCYRVRVGESPTSISAFSDPACATIESPPPAEPPAAPAGLVATTVNEQRIDLAWIDESDNETGFRIERALGAAGAFEEIDLTGANVTDYQSTGLDADTEYCYRVRAFNDVGSSAYTPVSCATTDPEVTPPDPLGAPSDLTATPVGETAIELNWVDNATIEIGYEISRSTSGVGGPYATLVQSAGVNVTSFTDTAVVADQEYCYRVRVGASLTNLSAFSDPACATIESAPPAEPPGAPSGLSTTAVSFQRIDLSWTDNADDEAGFEIERSLGAGGTFQPIDVVGADVTAYQDGALDAATAYCYRVRAFNDAGDSAYTATSCSTTPEEPPVGSCIDTGNHDDLGPLWGITTIKAHLNATWQATQAAGCEVVPWYFGIDSGLDSDHPDLNVVEIMGFIAADPADDGEDDNGHGTHTAGTAAAFDGNGGVVGVAPGAPVYGFKVCGADGTCAIDDIIAGIDEVTLRKQADPDQPMVANMSLGGGVNAATDTAVRRSVNAGVVYTLSAGNGVLGACLFPADAQGSSPARVGDDLINGANGSDGNTARINGAITVTSSGETDADANCNFGAPVTVAAPGVDIFSTWLDGGYNTISGTSMAAPHAAGAAILYLQRNPSATPVEVEQTVVNELDPWTTNDLPNAGGRLDAETL